MIEKRKSLFPAAKYLQEPQVNRLKIAEEKINNADKSVREKAQEELSAAVAKASK